MIENLYCYFEILFSDYLYYPCNRIKVIIYPFIVSFKIVFAAYSFKSIVLNF